MEWMEIINKLRAELDYLEATLDNHVPPLNEYAKVMVTKGFITTFANNLYPEMTENDDEADD